MSTNVTPVGTGGIMMAVATVASISIAVAASAGSAWAWSPPPATVGDGICARACAVAACMEFEGTTAHDANQCAIRVGADFSDLRRAGPDQACVQRCVLHGAPVDLALLSPGYAGNDQN